MMSGWRLFWQRQLRRAGKKLDRRRERGMRAQWFLLVGRRDRAGLESPRPLDLTPIYPPDEVFWADPFVWTRDGRHFIFFEEYPYATRVGRICVIEVDDALHPVGPAVRVLEEPHHLSYPFLFEVAGALFMIPEKANAQRLDLYRCTEIPNRWEHVRTLIAGMSIADATLFEDQGRWWMLASVKDRARGIDWMESLFVFYADDPLTGAWTPHAANPVLRDFSRGRPAGRVLRDRAGRLLRPSQDCVRRYGHGINLSRIDSLSPTEYSERVIWRKTGAAAGGWRGIHHLDWHEGLMVMDAQRLIPTRGVQDLP
jgi:hypothetical protein